MARSNVPVTTPNNPEVELDDKMASPATTQLSTPDTGADAGATTDNADAKTASDEPVVNLSGDASAESDAFIVGDNEELGDFAAGALLGLLLSSDESGTDLLDQIVEVGQMRDQWKELANYWREAASHAELIIDYQDAKYEALSEDLALSEDIRVEVGDTLEELHFFFKTIEVIAPNIVNIARFYIQEHYDSENPVDDDFFAKMYELSQDLCWNPPMESNVVAADCCDDEAVDIKSPAGHLVEFAKVPVEGLRDITGGNDDGTVDYRI